MISSDMIGNNGRLGNALFQYASLMGLAKKNNVPLSLNKWKGAFYFKGEYPEGLIKGQEIKEPHFHYAENLGADLSKDVVVRKSYLQSPKYWDGHEAYIRQQLAFKESFVDVVRGKYRGLFKKPTVAIHVRRGDYVNHQGYVSLPPLYYLRALIEKIPNWKDCNLLFFSDDQSYVKFHYACLDNAFFPHGDEMEDLCLMAQCDHFIIANSSFSWWGAFLGEKPHSVVVRPERYFSGTLAGHRTEDLYPDRWAAFDERDSKLDASDVTFVIPLSFDHHERFENLSLAVEHIISSFDTKFSFIEHNGRKFGAFSPIRFFDGPKFHRTKMLNDAIGDCNTKFAVNFDSDVLLPPAQVMVAIEKLRSGSDIVYPYSGDYWHVIRIPAYSQLKRSMDVGVLSKGGYRKTIDSRGGAVFLNVASFFRAGGENENFVSHGPEDQERFIRFTKLGLKVEFVNGCIVHVEHWRGKNSNSMGHPDGQSNLNEYKKVVGMSERELAAYVKTWSWAK